MKAPQLATSNPLVELVAPDIARDAPLGVEWLRGEHGRDTLRMMGVPDKDNVPTSLEKEIERVSAFIDRKDQLNWMIKFDECIIGCIWVDVKQHEGLPAPSVHIMIGDLNARGKGIGNDSIKSVIAYLQLHGYHTIYSRYLLANIGSAKLLEKQGFSKNEAPYTDQDGPSWQNVSRSLD